MKTAVTKICKHFRECGGCKFQDIEYSSQLKKKEEYFKSILFKGGVEIEFPSIVASPSQYFYRNKMEYSFGLENNQLICGLHKRVQKREVFGLEECLIFSEDIGLITKAVCRYFQEKNLPVYNPYTHKGFLRHLVVRESKFTSELMINLVTTSLYQLDKEEFVSILKKLKLRAPLISVIWTINDTFSDAVIPQRWEVLEGRDYIEERIGEFIFHISPFSFFQANPYILPDFYQSLKTDFLKGKTFPYLLDLFSGSAVLSIVLAKQIEFIWAVEKERDSIQDARINSSLNKVSNICLICGEVKKVLRENMDFWKEKINVVIVNPPRAGIPRKIIERIKKIKPSLIVYSSCNPLSFVENVVEFFDSYSLSFLKIFDFFPHTPHLEVLGLLIKGHVF